MSVFSISKVVADMQNPNFLVSGQCGPYTSRPTSVKPSKSGTPRKFVSLAGETVTINPGDKLPDWLCARLGLSLGATYEDLP